MNEAQEVARLTRLAFEEHERRIAELENPPPKPEGSAEGGKRSDMSTAGSFTAAQISDRQFYEAHRDEIIKAMAEGRIQ